MNYFYFLSRNRKNADAKDYLPVRFYEKHVLKKCNNYFNKLITSTELNNATIILSEDQKRVTQATTVFMNKKPKKKWKIVTDNTEKRIEWASFLSGKVQFGIPLEKLIPLYRRECLARVHNVAVLITLNATSLVDIIKNHEHTNFRNKDQLNETELNETKYFHPKNLTALEWDKDNVDGVMESIMEEEDGDEMD